MKMMENLWQPLFQKDGHPGGGDIYWILGSKSEAEAYD